MLRKVGYQITRFDATSYQYRDRMKEFLDAHVPQGKILDIGSGPWPYPKEHFKNVTTLDVQPPADVIGSILDLPFDDASYDCIICLETLEHVTNPLRAMDEVYRVLKPGGTFVGSAPFAYELHGEDYGDYWRITRQCWDRLLLKKFKDKVVLPYAGRTLTPGWYLVTAKK